VLVVHDCMRTAGSVIPSTVFIKGKTLHGNAICVLIETSTLFGVKHYYTHDSNTHT
jgi:hypothetical protein